MGRRDAVQFTLEWAAEARRLGATVEFLAGWETRGNGMSANYEGLELHHTAFLSSEADPFPAKNTLKDGRTDLGGPLANVGGPWCPDGAPRLVVIAAHPSNNAGASGGKNTAPLPVTSLFNPLVFALEIDYGGVVPMSKGQRKAATIFCRAGINVLRKSTDWIKAHADTSITGKWDPGYTNGKTIDMGEFRQGVANFSDQGDDDLMAAADDILAKLDDLAARVGGVQYMTIPKGGWTGEEGAIIVHLGALEAQVAMLLGIVSKGADVDEKALAAELAPVVAPLLADILKSELAVDGDMTPEQLADAVDAGLRKVLGSLDAV